MRFTYLAVFSLVVLCCLSIQAAEERIPESIARWRKEMDKFAAADKASMPEPGQILFVGSSSIRMWDLKKSFPKLQTINRGFGGSRLEDSVFYADEIILPYKPKTVAVYAGDNDIKAEYTPERILEDFREFVGKIRAELPETKILYIAVKPSLSRWNLIKEVRATNQLIQKECNSITNCEFLDIDTPMLGKDGKPRKELFKKDGLHLNDEGYQIWAEVIRPHLN